MRQMVRLPSKKLTTHAQLTAWLSTVARAAPRTPIEKPKMKMGSSTMLHTAPINTDSIPVLEKPWAMIKEFMPSVSCTNTVPSV